MLKDTLTLTSRSKRPSGSFEVADKTLQSKVPLVRLS